MRKVILYIAVSLDGFIADRQGGPVFRIQLVRTYGQVVVFGYCI